MGKNKKDKTTMKFQNLLLVLILLISYSLTSKVQESCEETFLSEEEAQEGSEEEFQSMEEVENEEAEDGDSMNDQKLEVIKKRFPGFEPQQLLTIMKLIELNHRNRRLFGENLGSLKSLLRKR